MLIGACRLLAGSSFKTWDFQSLLPSLPVPPLSQTCRTYLQSVQPLLSDGEYAATTAAVKAFQAPGGAGERLQSLLKEYARTRRNYMVRWECRVIRVVSFLRCLLLVCSPPSVRDPKSPADRLLGRIRLPAKPQPTSHPFQLLWPGSP